MQHRVQASAGPRARCPACSAARTLPPRPCPPRDSTHEQCPVERSYQLPSWQPALSSPAHIMHMSAMLDPPPPKPSIARGTLSVAKGASTRVAVHHGATRRVVGNAASQLRVALSKLHLLHQAVRISLQQQAEAGAASAHGLIQHMSQHLQTAVLDKWSTGSASAQIAQLQAANAALQDANVELTAHMAAATAKAEYLESRVSIMQAQQQRTRALHAVHSATQHFRRHLTDTPQALDPTQFYEQEDKLIGKGGCAKVYGWTSCGKEWAVKVDPISYRYAYTGAFEPERCADLLPALLPPHANILAPVAWWVAGQPGSSPAGDLSAATQAALPQPVKESFRLYTCWPLYTCSLHDHLNSSHTASAKPGTTDQPAPGMDLRSTLVVIRDVAAALCHLAAHRVLHCDLKPENLCVMLESVAPGQPQRVVKAGLIDFGLARLLPDGVDKLDARGGTWLYKAPEQMSGPPASLLLGVSGSSAGEGDVPALFRERELPHVGPNTDIWALGAIICSLWQAGGLRSRDGLPMTVPLDQVLKWGDRPNGRGGVEPFYMLSSDTLPTLNNCMLNGPESVTSSLADQLRALAQACMHPEPGQRPSAAYVKDVCEQLLAAHDALGV